MSYREAEKIKDNTNLNPELMSGLALYFEKFEILNFYKNIIGYLKNKVVMNKSIFGKFALDWTG
jgi:hypothetical protein